VTASQQPPEQPPPGRATHRGVGRPVDKSAVIHVQQRMAQVDLVVLAVAVAMAVLTD